MSLRSLAIIFLCAVALSAVTASAYMNSVSILTPNSPPVSMDDSYTLHGNGVIGPMVANDSDPDGNPITATLLTYPTYGSLSNTVGASIRIHAAARPGQERTASRTRPATIKVPAPVPPQLPSTLSIKRRRLWMTRTTFTVIRRLVHSARTILIPTAMRLRTHD